MIYAAENPGLYICMPDLECDKRRKGKIHYIPAEDKKQPTQ
jgi:hypothetical protein